MVGNLLIKPLPSPIKKETSNTSFNCLTFINNKYFPNNSLKKIVHKQKTSCMLLKTIQINVHLCWKTNFSKAQKKYYLQNDREYFLKRFHWLQNLLELWNSNFSFCNVKWRKVRTAQTVRFSCNKFLTFVERRPNMEFFLIRILPYLINLL